MTFKNDFIGNIPDIDYYYDKHIDKETPTEVQKRLQKYFSDDVDVRQGSLVGDLTRGNAEEFAYAYAIMRYILKSSVLNPDMPSEALTLKALEYGIERYEAKGSEGYVTFTGEEGIRIPAGTEVRTDIVPYKRYITDNSVTIGESGKVTVKVYSKDRGAHTVAYPGDIDTVVGNLSGVLEVTNEEAIDGGYDEQSDKDLYDAVINALRRPITSGNVYHYEMWATQIEGIRRARVYPLWNGNGTVKVVLLSASGTSPTEEKIEEVRQHIENERPIGATVTVTGAKERVINVEAELEAEESIIIEDLANDYKEMAAVIFSDTAFRTDVVRYSRMTAMALELPGVIDWHNFKINGQSGNIQLDDDEVAVIGDVKFTKSR